MKPIDYFTNMCINNGYITQEQAPWLHYGIEKRVTAFIISIPMLIVGSLVSSPAVAFSFYFSFYLLRSRTNGFHAKSFGGCVILSILTETFFLGILPRVWNDTVVTALLIASIIIIFVLAPYNHPNMDLSSEEIVECARSAKRRLSVLILFLIVLHILQFNQLATGIIIGETFYCHFLSLLICINSTEKVSQPTQAETTLNSNFGWFRLKLR